MQKQLTFNKCTLSRLEKRFGLLPRMRLSVLDNWLASGNPISEEERRELLGFQQLLVKNVQHWQEQELALQFIGPVIAMADFTEMERQINFFSLRLIEFKLDGTRLFGRPDGMIASGFRSPEIPYFAFHEFKKNTEPSGDPAGQALAAMLVGQCLNDNRNPVYGCYVHGRDWYFMALDGKEYAISRGYDATIEHVFDILRILKALKQIVIELTSGN